ncbi:CysB family HTH-type transcriptional regulator [Paludibacterium yongneupense]|uniref:CysB family HTH-type transcriptional regulator n=1 Tax=Paludibacterium yongneupense TaxID=400061 RepID=UPI000426FD65|nr:CysB family HTH-type transcriptional regulator [Paludibacterium yongneupense]
MNLQQLRIIREAVRQDYNLTDVASALYTSQPGVSKHIKDIEDELGVEIFVRRGKRLLGLTDPGRELVGVVERILLDTQNLRRIAAQFSSKETGNLVIATTHTQARYVLPSVITQFRKDYPKVHLVLHQGSPGEIADMLREGRADIGIATEGLASQPDLATFACYDWQHAIIVPDGHPLTREPRLTLESIARYPLVTYHLGFTGRANIDRRFAEAGLQTDIVLSAIDADVIKAYVETGLGVGIIAEMAFDPERNSGLTLLPTHDLFVTNTTHLALRRGRYLRSFAYRFIEYFVPELDEESIERSLKVELEPV